MYPLIRICAIAVACALIGFVLINFYQLCELLLLFALVSLVVFDFIFDQVN